MLMISLGVPLILNDTDQLEETAALVDLVENGANLLRAVDCLLRDIHTLSGVSGECPMSVMLCFYSALLGHNLLPEARGWLRV